MSTSVQRRMAGQLYDSGHALFQQGRYHEALSELHRAENTFRELDARGHPFSIPLSNGISGLANSLALSGACCQKLGNYSAAVTYYETSLINAKFEKKKYFRSFMTKLAEDLAACYEKVADGTPRKERERLLGQEPEIDPSFRFPYCLPQDLIPFARLYELSPGRHAEYEPFYSRAQRKDARLRRELKRSDDATARKMSLSVWGILAAVWVVYALIVIKALISD